MEAAPFWKLSGEKGLKPAAILLTHGHYDHMGGVEAFTKVYDVPVYANEGGKSSAESGSECISDDYGGRCFPTVENLLKDNLIFTWEMRRCLPRRDIPAAEPYYLPEGGYAFEESVGERIFQRQLPLELIRSITERLIPLGMM